MAGNLLYAIINLDVDIAHKSNTQKSLEFHSSMVKQMGEEEDGKSEELEKEGTKNYTNMKHGYRQFRLDTEDVSKFVNYYELRDFYKLRQTTESAESGTKMVYKILQSA